MKDILKSKGFRSKLETKNRKIYYYIGQDGLLLEFIIKDFSNYIYTIIRNSYMTLSDEDAEEVILDVMFIIWRNQNKLDVNRKMSSYIAGITKNLMRKKYRDKKIVDNIDDYEEKLVNLNDIEVELIEKETNKELLYQVEKLKDEDKDVFIKYYYEEMNIKQISNSTCMSESKIKSKLFRIRNRLKKYLKKEGYSSNGK